MKLWIRPVLVSLFGILLIVGCGDNTNNSLTSVDGVSAENTSYYPDWMSKDPMIQKASLSKIAIPGAHDAGMGIISKCSDYAASTVTKTQNKSFSEMLNSGIRHFDIRAIIDENNTLQIGHFGWVGHTFKMKYFIDVALAALGPFEGGIIYEIIKNTTLYNKEISLRNEGCYGYAMDTMLDDVQTFMGTSQHEVVILDISHFMNFKKYDFKDSYFDNDDYIRLAKKINEKIGAYLVQDTSDLLTTSIKELTENGSRVIVIFDENNASAQNVANSNIGIFDNNAMNIYNSYANTNKVDDMKKDQFEKSRDNSDNRYFLLSWTLTLDNDQVVGCMLEKFINEANFYPLSKKHQQQLKDAIMVVIQKEGHVCTPIEKLASEANTHIDEIPNDSSEGNPNILLFDDVSYESTSKAIGINGNRLHYKWLSTDTYIEHWFGTKSQGGGITIGDTDGDGRVNLLALNIDNPKHDNAGYYRVSSNLENDGSVQSWGERILVPGWFGWESQGGGITIGDADGDGRPNLIVFHIDHQSNKNAGYYRVSANLENDGSASFWSDPISIPGWFGTESQGGGIAIGDTDGDGIPNLIVFNIDNPEGENHGYYRGSSNLKNDGSIPTWGPPVKIPGWFGGESQGGGVSIGDTDGDGIPNLVVFHIDNPDGENRGYYRVSSNLEHGLVSSWGDPIGIPGWFGDENQGGGITIGNVDGDDILDLIKFNITNIKGENHGYYGVGISLKE